MKTVTFSRFWHHQCIDMAETRKQIAFDLDTKALETYYPSESWNNAYEVIKRHMLKNGFSLRIQKAGDFSRSNKYP